jgi:hypothetical protein
MENWRGERVGFLSDRMMLFSSLTSRHETVHRPLKLDSDLSRHPSKSSYRKIRQELSWVCT